ncbi:protein kinase [Solirubrobacter sp. CPCC 204708]|uniref:non-specific serine/threonine protein kinase n=1 Tax=Solirubrobacter deserti TaxID=2282478 RepID=A0ABT4RHL7_9ACTN|nr:serine/threonine-protein kinase [Solirubrobacter deserti]MBE2316513.1 protein kinase [Solirubrobacter deserti]MDA0138046.1 protein kinase [Solirubrobacter deserti]
MPELAVGAAFADHIIRGVAGRGGMGVVYRAVHLALKREVALKVIGSELSAQPEFRVRFQRECETAASIQHPRVVTIYHAGEEDGLLYVTMRYVDGTDLSRMLIAKGRLDVEDGVRIVKQVADGLQAAHEQGLVHRDVKPANILLDADGFALLGDFGLTKHVAGEEPLTREGVFVGTIDYAAPEQFEGGPVDARTDVYALGCVLYQVLSGRVPYPAESDAAKMYAHLQAPAPRLDVLTEDVPPVIADIVARAMVKDPADRFQDAGELAAALRQASARPTIPGDVTVVSDAQGGDRVTEIPLPPALSSEVGGGTFVGREEPLERLRVRYRAAEQGTRQFVLISGEPGIGKTRLASELARQVHAGGATVLFGRSDAESLVPYQPFITAIQHRVAHRQTLSFPPELLPDLAELGRFIPALRRMAPEPPPIEDEPEVDRFRLFAAVTRLLAFVAREHPVVLILDDVQWADASTVLLLAHMLGDPDPVKLLVVATMRDSEELGGELLDLLARLRRQPSMEQIALTGLDPAETEALVLAREGVGVRDSVIRRLHADTDGNPFFIEELLRGGEEAVPEGVKAMISRRLARLDELTVQVVTAASVVGREFRLEVLEVLIPQPVERLISALEAAIGAGLIREVEDDVDRFVFAHALVREALYERQSASRRVRAHYAIAQALEGLAPRFTVPSAELAHHYSESRHLDRAGKAIDYAVAAAHQAAAMLSWEQAAGHYRRALDGDLPAERRCELLLALGDAEARSGHPAARDTFARAAMLARRSVGPDALARAALGFAGRYAEAGIVDRDGIALLEEALEALGDEDSALGARVRARLADSLHFAGAPERTFALSRDALEMARRTGDPEAQVAALQSRHAALLHVSHLDERLVLDEEILALAERIGVRELEALGRHWRIYDLLEAGSTTAARDEHEALARLAEQLRQPLYRHFARGWDVVWAQMSGRVAEAERFAREAHELGQRAQARDADTIYAAQLLTLRRREGRLAEYVSTVETFVERHPALVAWRAVLPLAHLLNGEREEGIAAFEELCEDDFAAVPRDMFWFTAMCVLGEACSHIGDADRAKELYGLLLPHRDRMVQVTQAACFGSAERFLGLLAATFGDIDLASEHFEAALVLNADRGVLPLIPFIRAEYAQRLLGRGTPADGERARELLVTAYHEAEAAQITMLVARLRPLLDATGAVA